MKLERTFYSRIPILLISSLMSSQT